MNGRVTLALLAALPPLCAAAQDGCTAQGVAEQDRITREFSSQRPARGDKDAELAWSRNLYAALAAAAKRAEDCTRASRVSTPPSAAAMRDECIAESNRRADELEHRYRGRTLTAQEQATRRAEEQRLLDERMDCGRRPGR